MCKNYIKMLQYNILYVWPFIMSELDFRIETIHRLTNSFLQDNPNISNIADVREPCGKEHYFFLASIGMQLKNNKIIELGTHNGRSTIALNYGNMKQNNQNTIYTYDIYHHLLPNIFNNTTIVFKMENLFDQSIREQNREHILSADLIFIDVDPHEGVVEYDFYLWLKANNFEGIILFDDIHLGCGHLGVNTGNCMQQFWDKIEDEYKYDLTTVGHWSGTGIVLFHKEKWNILLD